MKGALILSAILLAVLAVMIPPPVSLLCALTAGYLAAHAKLL